MHGGLPGLRSIALLDSALDAPKNLYYYAKPDVYDLAACYGGRLAAKCFLISQQNFDLELFKI